VIDRRPLHALTLTRYRYALALRVPPCLPGLLKHGIGRWVQILDTGLLPGKMIQQLNGQTQRLLGQQSLAAYTGLRLDIDRIRADNEALSDSQVTRKAGLIINDGSKLSKEEKASLQEVSKVKYALTQAQMDAVDAALEEIYSARTEEDAVGRRHRGLVEAWGRAVKERPGKEEVEGWGREARVERLKVVMGMLEEAQGVWRYQVGREVGGVFCRKHKAGEENDGKAANGGVVGEENEKHAKNAKKANNKRGAKATKATKATKASKKNNKKNKKDANEEPMDLDLDGVEEQERETADACRDAGMEADIGQLVAMGFGRRQAMDALEETNGSVEGAVEWLMVHCV